MINIATHFGQAAAKVSGQQRGSLKSILTELQGLRVSYAAGVNAGSTTLAPTVTITSNDSLLGVFLVGSAADLTKALVGSCELLAGSANNLKIEENFSSGNCIVFWFDCDNG